MNLLSEEYVIVTPVLAYAEAFAEATILICFSEEPGRIHEVFSCQKVHTSVIQRSDERGRAQTEKILRDLFVPQCHVCLAIIDDGSQLGMLLQLDLQLLHPLDALDQVHNAVLGRLLVETGDDVLDRLSEDGGQTMAHGGIGERVSVVAAKSGPWGVVGIDLCAQNGQLSVTAENSYRRTDPGVRG